MAEALQAGMTSAQAPRHEGAGHVSRNEPSDSRVLVVEVKIRVS